MFKLQRVAQSASATAGVLYADDGTKLCATLERAWDNNETAKSRIPAGTYDLRLKPLGSSHFDGFYSKEFGSTHKGMIEIAGVPGRSSILFHMLNYWFQTEGCIGCGSRTEQGSRDLQIPPGESRPGYLAAYAALLAAVETGGAKLEVTDVPATPIA